MDAVEFFSTNLREIPLTAPPVAEGICASHNQPAPLFKMNGHHICRGCALLRQTYPTPPPKDKKKAQVPGQSRLGLGSYMLVTPTQVDFWGNHLLPSPVHCHPASGALRGIVRDLILNPPPPPWLFIAFARSNSAERLHMTVSNDLMFFGGKFLFPMTMDEPPVDRLDRRYVMALHAAAKLTKEQWEKAVRAHTALTTSPDALTYLQDIYQQHPGLQRLPLPVAKTAEYNAIRLLADDGV